MDYLIRSNINSSKSKFPDVLYHYTNYKNASSIINMQQILMKPIYLQKDKLEYYCGVRKLFKFIENENDVEEIIKRKKDVIEIIEKGPCFSLFCMTEESSSKYHYNIYGNIRIGLSTIKLNELLNKDKNCIFSNCVYFKDQIEERYRKHIRGVLLGKYLSREKLLTITKFALLIKSRKYYKEKEIRIVSVDKGHDCYKLRMSGDVIKEIVIEPSSNKNLIRKEIEILRNKNHLNFEINESSIP